MIADTTFLSDLLKELRQGRQGPAHAFFAAHRSEQIRTTAVSVAEIAVMFQKSQSAWEWLARWKIYRFNDGIISSAADVDRFLTVRGQRLGENDNWIAGFAAYLREPIISHDAAFDRIPGIRRIAYERD